MDLLQLLKHTTPRTGIFDNGFTAAAKKYYTSEREFLTMDLLQRLKKYYTSEREFWTKGL
jgi:hypothetical protein